MRLPATGNPGKRRLAVRLGWLVALLALFMDRQVAFAQTKAWSGVVSALWSEPGNWVGGQVPVDGDSLLFPYYGSFSHTMWNDIPGPHARVRHRTQLRISRWVARPSPSRGTCLSKLERARRSWARR